MQTKKKLLTRNAAREHANPRVCRSQRKVSENVEAAEKKVTELITSARKQRFAQLSAGILLNKSKEAVTAKTLNSKYLLEHNGTHDICLGYDTFDESSIDCKNLKNGTDSGVLETIFSPAFHISKDVGAGITNGVFVKFFRRKDQEILENCVTELQGDILKSPVTQDICDSLLEQTNSHWDNRISPTGCPIEHSKLECIDEPTDDSMSSEVYMEEENIEEIDEFDPYLFIKNLPDLSSVVPTFRPMLLPKQTRSCPPTTLVLDLDETLVHSTLEHCEDADFTFPVNFNFKEHTVYVRCRPHLNDFMERVASLFEIIIFTASQSIYAEQLLNMLDPKRRIFRHRVYRESCVFVGGNYLKDLSVLGRDLAQVIIVDNSPQAFGFQVDNGIPIESWFDDRSDHELLLLLPFLESLVGVEDVRPLIAKKFNLREKVAAASPP
ncbi:PREDICTED: CTD small phosphatase-like protein 2 [Nelumbo nucifera]|uniref:CTD small phosphatase-like protein 2 n=1 Tax=Nelumbo nucifera TaxID=4432 RepID=A0A1U8Q2P8_NELNU|nr:PREDICTED: CTD small phosphatase-like protein 2 [Nelumbo nucifera]